MFVKLKIEYDALVKRDNGSKKQLDESSASAKQEKSNQQYVFFKAMAAQEHGVLFFFNDVTSGLPMVIRYRFSCNIKCNTVLLLRDVKLSNRRFHCFHRNLLMYSS